MNDLHNPAQRSIPTNFGALTTLITVFFFWGFIAAGNSIFIPFCKHYFSLDQFQSQLVDFAFYLAYYIGSLLLYLIGGSIGKDLVGAWGYKKSIVYGLLFSAVGAGCMIVAVQANTFYGMLGGLFMVALGFSLQQTAANPFAAALGDPSTGSARISLGGGVNSFGTTIGPIVIALALFGTTRAVSDEAIQSLPLSKVVLLYSAVGVLFILAAVLFSTSKKVPAGKTLEAFSSSSKASVLLIVMTILLTACFTPVITSYQKEIVDQAEKAAMEMYRLRWLLGALAVVILSLLFAMGTGSSIAGQKPSWGAMQYPQLVLGMLALFFYVGVEVTVGSNLGELLKTEAFGNLQASEVTPYVSLYWGSLMIGRWAGAVGAFELSAGRKKLFTLLMPLIAFIIILFVSFIAGYNIQPLYGYIVCVIIQMIAFYVSDNRPAITLQIFGMLGMGFMLVGLMSTGIIATYAFLSGGLCCSIMWPYIFNLSIAGLGRYTTQGAAFLVMMILGGAIIPPIQGKLADVIGIHESYWLAFACFAYLTFFAFAVKAVLRRQGIDYDVATASGRSGH